MTRNFSDDQRAAIARSIVRRIAAHEAGHAVFIWRGRRDLNGDYDDLVPFDEIVISAPLNFGKDFETVAPLVLADGEQMREGVAGTVLARSWRVTVPQTRSLAGLSRAKHREQIKR